MCRAAHALQRGDFTWLELAFRDADLRRVLSQWYSLPTPIRRGILAVVGSQEPTDSG
jgi:hypothetical protein